MKSFHLKYDNTKNVSVSYTETFSKCENVEGIANDDFDFTKINVISWCVNAAGYVALSWDNGQQFCVLSGNGKWNLETPIPVPFNCQGKLNYRCVGFDALDSFTLIIDGLKK